ncbi:hypothetical protein [Hymenobacter lapidarius]|nr:hypothetical protein [Hymenobacter lapidarius]
MSTLVQVQAAAVVVAEFLFGEMLLIGFFRVGQLTLARVRKS